jgi:hypothetical protein
VVEKPIEPDEANEQPKAAVFPAPPKLRLKDWLMTDEARGELRLLDGSEWHWPDPPNFDD